VTTAPTLERTLPAPIRHSRSAEGSPPEWPLRQRLAWLARFGRAVRDAQDELCELAMAEIGKPRHEALAADLLPLLASVDWHRREAASLLAPRRLAGGPIWLLSTRVEVRREPLGRVAIIATWNYPIQLLGIQLVQALVAGNSVVVKPSERSPRTQRRLLGLAEAAGLPEGVLEVRPADRAEGERLVRETLDHLVFTGSTAVGRQIARAAAERLLPTTLELSGRDSAIVRTDADLALAARSVARAFTLNSGQTCMAPRRVLVERDAYAGFLAAITPLVAGAKPLGLVDEAAAAATHAAAVDALERGGRSVSGSLEPPKGRFLLPVAIADATPAGPLWDGDHFGPALAIAPVDDLDEAIELHRRNGQALATAVYTRSPRSVAARAGEFRSSVVTVNDAFLPTAHPAASLGGLGPSGWGVSRGAAGLLAMTREVTLTRTGRLFRLDSGDPATPSAIAGLRRLIAFPRRPAPLDRVPSSEDPAR
jgi:acyl-CoA reductase-like NAD-dependent aldehyde dehydrogenase